jgi:hypothetical protein
VAATNCNSAWKQAGTLWGLSLMWIASQSAPLTYAGVLGQPVPERLQTLKSSNLWGAGQWTRKESDLPHPAVVRVIAPEQGAISYGSGTLVDVRDQFGLVITNWHVVRDAQGDVEVLFPDGFRSKARALKVDADWDLAALVIWRPSVPPVTLADSAPRPGDPLTICGYGQGRYRAITGSCTQYYSPKENLPQQMVELDVEARQGDSGGPIFNQHGQLAGVLFGAGQGTTLGSFGGRVKSFLATLAPDIGQRADDVLLQADSKQSGALTTQGSPMHDTPALGEYANSEITNWDTPHGESSNLGQRGPASCPAHSMASQTMASQFANRNRYQNENREVWKPVKQASGPNAAIVATDRGVQERTGLAEDDAVGRAVDGAGWYEQAKSVLAVIGLLAIVSGVLKAAR